MKVSKYTILLENENKEIFVYSALSDALIEIDEESFSFLRLPR
jgi:sRNA-binding regulator protein Hfq